MLDFILVSGLVDETHLIATGYHTGGQDSRAFALASIPPSAEAPGFLEAISVSDTRLKSIVAAFRRGILGRGSSHDMCAAVCMPLQSYLSSVEGIDTRLTSVEFQDGGLVFEHCFLTLPDGRILDPTADQFNTELVKFPQVFLGKLPHLYQQWMAEASRDGELTLVYEGE